MPPMVPPIAPTGSVGRSPVVVDLAHHVMDGVVPREPFLAATSCDFVPALRTAPVGDPHGEGLTLSLQIVAREPAPPRRCTALRAGGVRCAHSRGLASGGRPESTGLPHPGGGWRTSVRVFTIRHDRDGSKPWELGRCLALTPHGFAVGCPRKCIATARASSLCSKTIRLSYRAGTRGRYRRRSQRPGRTPLSHLHRRRDADLRR